MRFCVSSAMRLHQSSSVHLVDQEASPSLQSLGIVLIILGFHNKILYMGNLEIFFSQFWSLDQIKVQEGQYGESSLPGL